MKKGFPVSFYIGVGGSILVTLIVAVSIATTPEPTTPSEPQPLAPGAPTVSPSIAAPDPIRGIASAIPVEPRRNIRAEAKTHCMAEWPDDLSMQAYCLRKATAGASTFAAITARHQGNPAMQRALARCIEEWSDDSIDWSMIAYCAGKQEAALQELAD